MTKVSARQGVLIAARAAMTVTKTMRICLISRFTAIEFGRQKPGFCAGMASIGIGTGSASPVSVSMN